MDPPVVVALLLVVQRLPAKPFPPPLDTGWRLAGPEAAVRLGRIYWNCQTFRRWTVAAFVAITVPRNWNGINYRRE